MISLSINGVHIEQKLTGFSDGATGVKFLPSLPRNPENAVIRVISEGCPNDEFFQIASIVDILRSINAGIRIHLFLPYAPYARQDRRMDKHDAFSGKIYAGMINSLKLDRVTVLDAHSDVLPALIDNCVNISQDFILSDDKLHTSISGWANALVCPDAGAAKKAYKAAMMLGFDPNATVYMEKVRDTRDGSISSTKIASDPSTVMGAAVVIIDDIVDGGRTFTESAAALYDAGATNVGLFVSHGIFSRGLKNLTDAGIDKIWTTNSINSPFLSTVSRNKIETVDVNKIFQDYYHGNY